MTNATNWTPVVQYPILRGSSEWMSEMAWVVSIDGVRVVIRATIHAVTTTGETLGCEFRGQVVSHSSRYSGALIYGCYDPSFRQPNWLVLEEEA